MDASARYSGNPTGLRYAAYFVLFIGTLFGLATLRIAHQEYRAQDAWPIASGEVLSSEEQSRVVRGSRGPNSTVYWMTFTVVFDPPLDQCRPGMLWITAGGPTRCVGTSCLSHGGWRRTVWGHRSLRARIQRMPHAAMN